MEQKYKITAIIISLFIAFCPLLTNGFISYADNVPGGSGGAWDPIETHEDIVAAFKAYCQTTGLNTEHVPNTINAIVKWDYSQLQKYAALANVDLEGLNAHIWYQIKQNKPLKFYFDSTGITTCQKIYAQIVSDNNLTANTSKTISTKYFEDSDGNSCYCFVRKNLINQYYQTRNFSDYNNNIQFGTYYRFTGLSFFTNNPDGSYLQTINYHNTSRNYYIGVGKRKDGNDNFNSVVIGYSAPDVSSWGYVNTIYLDVYNNTSSDGYLCIIYDSYTHKYYLGTYMSYLYNGTTQYYTNCESIELPDLNTTNSDITYNQGEPVTHPQDKGMQVTTGDTTINNYITNNNTNITYNYDDNNEPPSTLTPLPQTPNYPTGGTQNPDGSFNWTMPDLNIDFHIDSDISDIFPFSIPFDIIHFFDIFDSEPVTPEVDTTFEICNIEIPIQFDLHWLDDTAAYFRAFVLAIYCFGLAIATRALFHIY